MLLVAGALPARRALVRGGDGGASRETGGAATFVRRAFNDLAGFLTGWVLFLDYLIVIALAALFVPHYLGGGDRLATRSATSPGTSSSASCVIARRRRRPARPPAAALHGSRSWSPLVALVTQLAARRARLRAPLLAGRARRAAIDLGDGADVARRSRSRCRSRCSPTPASRRSRTSPRRRASPGETLPRSLFVGIGVGRRSSRRDRRRSALSAFPPQDGATTRARRRSGCARRCVGVVDALGARAARARSATRCAVYVGVSGALVLIAAATTSISGFGPARLLARRARDAAARVRPAAPPDARRRRVAIVGAAVVAVALLVVATASSRADEVAFLASLFSFGVLLAFTRRAARRDPAAHHEPDLRRPFRVPFDVRLRGREMPLPALVGLALTSRIWVVALATHPGARSRARLARARRSSSSSRVRALARRAGAARAREADRRARARPRRRVLARSSSR